MTRPFLQLRRGTSIIEMLVTIFVFSMIMTIVTAMFFVLLQTYNINDAQAQLIGNASNIQTRFLADVNQAHGILASAAVNYPDPDVPSTYTSGQNAIILRVAALDPQGNPIVNTCDTGVVNACDTIIIVADQAPNDTHLLEITIPDDEGRSSRPAATKLLTGNLDQYVFTYRNADAVTSSDATLTMTLAKTAGHTTVTHTFRIYGKLRNT